MLDLKDFVRESIVQIVEGIKEAQEKTKGSGAVVNPELTSQTGDRIPRVLPPGRQYNPPAQLLEFDVAVSTTDEKTAEGRIAVLSAVGVGLKGLLKRGTESASRIKFGVFVVLPPAEKQGDATGR